MSLCSFVHSRCLLSVCPIILCILHVQIYEPSANSHTFTSKKHFEPENMAFGLSYHALTKQNGYMNRTIKPNKNYEELGTMKNSSKISQSIKGH